MLIDDYIFLCFLIGNDFIPKLPPLNIKNNGIDLLLSVYTLIINTQKEYLMNNEYYRKIRGIHDIATN